MALIEVGIHREEIISEIREAIPDTMRFTYEREELKEKIGKLNALLFMVSGVTDLATRIVAGFGSLYDPVDDEDSD